MARYTISYCSAPTGYGWREKTDSLAEVRKVARSRDLGRCITAGVDVWDSEIGEFIFVKRCLCYKPEVDLLKLVNS